MELDFDEILCINAPSSVLAFNFPSVFVFDNVLYSNVDDYVDKKLTDFVASKETSFTFAEDVIENEIVSAYDKAIRKNLAQNRFAREALIRNKNALLVDLRPFSVNKSHFESKLALNLGAFDGNLQEFSSFINNNSLSSQTLARWWFTDNVPVLKSVGKNRLGLLLMNIRRELLEEDSAEQILIGDANFVKDFRPISTASFAENFDEIWFKTENFMTRDKISFITTKNDKRNNNPLNRFYPALFTVDKTDFISLEHYFWWKRLENITSSEFLCRILRTNDAIELKNMCETWLSSNTPVVDEDSVSDMEIFERGFRAKFEQNCSLAAYLVSDFNLLVYGSDEEIDSFKKITDRWSIPVKLLLSWWMLGGRKNNNFLIKPYWLMDNIYGLTLMKVRQRICDVYFSHLLPEEVSSNFIELEKQKQTCDDDVSLENNSSFYVFSDEDLLSLHSHSTGFIEEGVRYFSVAHYYWSICLKELNLLVESNTILAIENNDSGEKVFETLLTAADCWENYHKWQEESRERVLKDGVKYCLEFNDDFFDQLLATQELTLIYASESEIGVGMTKSTFSEFVKDLNLNSKSFVTLCKDSTCKPGCLGQNIWTNLLTELRSELKHVKLDETEEVSSRTLNNTDNILVTGDAGDSLIKETTSPKGYCEEKMDDDDKVCSWNDLTKHFVRFIKNEVGDDETTEKASANVELPMDTKKSALLSSFRQCYPNFTELINSVRNEADAYKLGQIFATTFEQMFGDNFKQAVDEFGFQDLHSLGRIAGFEQKYSS